MQAPRVIVVTATFRRPQLLAQLLASLRQDQPAVVGVVVVDNAGDAAVAALESTAPFRIRILTPGHNLGCGGGVALGLREALQLPAVTHAWIFDDDAAATPGALAAMLGALDAASADAVTPLVTDAAGRIGWFPGPLDEPAWSLIRRPGLTPAEFRASCGETPLRWNWAPWPSLLVTRRAIEAVGFPREDFWFQGEDLEWTLRLSAKFRGVLAPAAECRHFPPPGDAARARLKGAAMLQNNLFTASRLPHGLRILRHAPGNAWRFLRAQRFRSAAWTMAASAHWRGLVRGQPAGAPGADGFRQAWERA